MSRRLQIALAVVGVLVGGLLAYGLRLPRPAPVSPPPPEKATTPAGRQEPGRYVDEKFGFAITAAPGWRNETSGLLRKQFPGARGVLVREGTNATTFLQVDALETPAETQPDPEGFLKSTRQAFAASPAIKVRAAAVTTVAGVPTVMIETEASGFRERRVTRHLWVFGDGAQVHLQMSDAAGNLTRDRAAFDQMLASFTWTKPATQPAPPALAK